MRRTALFALAASAALVLTACGDSGGNAESGGTGDAAAGASGSATTAGDTASAAPDTAVSSPATPGATATTAATSRDIDSNPPGDDCGASQVAAFVAQEATPAVRARLAAKVGHNRIRWIGPDTVVTMDYSAARLNVTLDGSNVITGGRCG